MRRERKSTCPINLALELFGDRWTLLILRDLMFGGKRHFREFLQSEEKISSNTLADRMNSLVEQGLVTRTDDPTHRQKAIYSLTEKGLDLLPVLTAIGVWGRRYCPVTEQSAHYAVEYERRGAAMLKEMRAELAKAHGIK